VDLAPYRGVILGTAVRGLGLRGDTPSSAFQSFVSEKEGLEEKKVALFTAYRASPGQMLLRMRNAVEGRGCMVVVAHAYSLFTPERQEHVLPAECMVRIR
jgi:hypothetical protein